MIELLVNKGMFRNANHAIWFFSSMEVLAIFVLTQVGFRSPWLVFIVGGFHLLPFFTALKKWVDGIDSDVYSKDCIWFNAGMFAIYVIFFFLTKFY